MFRCVLATIFFLLGDLSSAEEDTFDNVYVVKSMQASLIEGHLNEMIRHLNKMGVDTSKLEQNVFNAGANTENIDRFLAQLPQKPKLIISMATLASKHLYQYCLDNNIGLFFITVSQPIEAGLIKEFDQPTYTNVSGVSQSLSTKKILATVNRVAKRIFPNKKEIRYGYLYSTYPSEVGFGQRLEKELSEFQGFTFKSAQFDYLPKDPKAMRIQLAELAKATSDQVDLYLVPTGPSGFFSGYVKTIQQYSNKTIIYTAYSASLAEGALLMIDSNSQEVGRIAAEGVYRIISGEQIGSIAPRRAEGMKMGLNMTTLNRLNISIPSDIVKAASNNLVR